jgi:hypothetical protein
MKKTALYLTQVIYMYVKKPMKTSQLLLLIGLFLVDTTALATYAHGYSSGSSYYTECGALTVGETNSCDTYVIDSTNTASATQCWVPGGGSPTSSDEYCASEASYTTPTCLATTTEGPLVCTGTYFDNVTTGDCADKVSDASSSVTCSSGGYVKTSDGMEMCTWTENADTTGSGSDDAYKYNGTCANSGVLCVMPGCLRDTFTLSGPEGCSSQGGCEDSEQDSCKTACNYSHEGASLNEGAHNWCQQTASTDYTYDVCCVCDPVPSSDITSDNTTVS